MCMMGNIPEFSPDGINLNFKLLPLYANEVIICKFGLFRSANSNSISLENLEGSSPAKSHATRV